MSNDAWVDLLKNLVIQGPWWGIGAILAFKSPQLVKAFFDGIARLKKLKLDHANKEKKKVTQLKADEA
jgi:hypothetical protein